MDPAGRGLTFRSYYDVLQVSPNADAEIVRTAYRVLAQRYHPDHSTSPNASARMAELNEAYAVLSDPARRLKYDLERAESLRRLGGGRASAAPESPPASRADATDAAKAAAPSSERRRSPRRVFVAMTVAIAAVVFVAAAGIVLRRPADAAPTETRLLHTPAVGWVATVQRDPSSAHSGAIVASLVDARVEADELRVKLRLVNRSTRPLILGAADFSLADARRPIPVSRSVVPGQLAPDEAADAELVFATAAAHPVVWCPRIESAVCVRF